MSKEVDSDPQGPLSSTGSVPSGANQNDDSEEQAFKIAQIAASLLDGDSKVNSGGSTEDYYTAKVEIAVRRARMILAASRRPLKGIRLYEFFEPGVEVNAGRISEFLDKIGWFSVSAGSITNRLDRIQLKWEQHLGSLKQHPHETECQGRDTLIKFEQGLQKLDEENKLHDKLPRFTELTQRLLSDLFKELPWTDEETQTISYHRYQQLYHWCFAFEFKDESKTEIKYKNYRFHELLRVSSDHGWLPEEFEEPQGALSATEVIPPHFGISRIQSFAAYNSRGVSSPLANYLAPVGI